MTGGIFFLDPVSLPLHLSHYSTSFSHSIWCVFGVLGKNAFIHPHVHHGCPFIWEILNSTLIIAVDVCIKKTVLFEIFYHCRCASVVGWNQDFIISVLCNTYIFIIDFRSFFDAKLWKTIPGIRFSSYFWLPEKIDGIMAVFPQKKSENYIYGRMVRESLPCDFQIFFDAKL